MKAEEKNIQVVTPLLVCSAMSMTHLIAFIRIDLAMFLLLFPLGVGSYLGMLFFKRVGAIRLFVPVGNMLVCTLWMAVANKATYDQYLTVTYNSICICAVLLLLSSEPQSNQVLKAVQGEGSQEKNPTLEISQTSHLQAADSKVEPAESGPIQPIRKKDKGLYLNDSHVPPITIDYQIYNHSMYDDRKTVEAKKYMESSAHNSIESVKAEKIEPRVLISDPSFMSRDSSDASFKH